MLLVGKGGSGKSTVALSSLGSELLYAGDDYVAVTLEPTPRVQSLYSSAKLEPHHVREFLPDLVPLVVERRAPRRGEGGPVRARALPGAHDRGVPASGRCRSEGHPGHVRAARIVPASRAAALAALAPSTIFQLHTADQTALSAMSRLVARVPCYGLELGSDVKAIPGRDRRPAPDVADRLKMATPLVTVIVASYNGERFLREALESVFAQDFESFEVVFVDDGSDGPDGRDRHVLPASLRPPGEQGASGRQERRTGRERKGELIAFLDDDDLLPPTKLGIQSRYLLDHPETGCVLGGRSGSSRTGSSLRS